MRHADRGAVASAGIEGRADGRGLHIGVVQARFNAAITERLAECCSAELAALGVVAEGITHVQVPGALEIGVALAALATSERFDALIALGCVIRGETYHFELVANESAAAITRLGIDHALPIANAILTVEDEAQAWARVDDKGRDAARVAVEMATLLESARVTATDRNGEHRDSVDTPPVSAREPAGVSAAPASGTSTAAAATAKPAKPGAPRAKPKSARRRSREFALQGLYEWLVGQADAGVIDAHMREQDGFQRCDAAHFELLLHGCIAEAASIDALLARHVDRKTAHLSPIEHGVLMIGCHELAHCIEIPYKVAINEAVELAKSFGGTDGHKYVNGVLDKCAAELRAIEVDAARAARR